MRVRKTAVAGRFYPDTQGQLDDQLQEIIRKELPAMDVTIQAGEMIGGIVPHAGYMYSGFHAMHFFYTIKKVEERFDTFIIINPNHTGIGPEIALEENDYWETPYGMVEIDKEFQELLNFSKSADAHAYEHSGEVMVPMLQFTLSYDFKILPITLFRQSPQNALRLAQAIAEANKVLQKRICLIASSDFSHFVDPEEGKKLDQLVIDQVLELNSAGVYQEVRNHNISVCGYGPIMTLIEYSKLVSKTPKVKILSRGHSGEVIPSKEVVDYITLLFSTHPH